MRVLIDTHVLMFAFEEPERLSARARKVVSGRGTRLVWSAVGTVELAIKVARGNLKLPRPLGPFLDHQRDLMGLEFLSVEHRHSVAVADLPLLHGDPFDRLLVAQAKVEGIPFVTSDTILKKYGIEVIW